MIECKYSGNRARIGARGTLHKVGTEPQIQTVMGCGPERQARDAAFFGFFAARPKVARAGEGRLRLSDGRTELVLERPALRRLAHVPPLSELVGRWTPQGATQTVAGGYHGWGFQSAYPLTIAAGRVSWPGCGGLSYPFRYTAEGRMLVAGGAAKSCGADDPGSALVRILAAGPLAERDASGGIALTAGKETVTLSERSAPPRRGKSG